MTSRKFSTVEVRKLAEAAGRSVDGPEDKVTSHILALICSTGFLAALPLALYWLEVVGAIAGSLTLIVTLAWVCGGAHHPRRSWLALMVIYGSVSLWPRLKTP
jgi:hypothetical protein